MDRSHRKKAAVHIIILIAQLLKNISTSIWASASDEILSCSGFRGEKSLLSPDRINDNYCDCPLEGGIDELNTEACSGAMDGGWSGIDASKHER